MTPAQNAPVKWLAVEKMKAPAYYAMARREADKAKVPLAYRAGGRILLGSRKFRGWDRGLDQTLLGGKRRSVHLVPGSDAAHNWRVIAD
ncbi:unnamed protein product, partial [Symbiodinium sp. CCMP2456]